MGHLGKKCANVTFPASAQRNFLVLEPFSSSLEPTDNDAVRNLLSCFLKPWGNVTIRPDTHNRQRSAHLAILRDTDSDNSGAINRQNYCSIYFTVACSRPTKAPAPTTVWMEPERGRTMARPDFHAVSRLAIERTAKGWSPDLRKRALGPSSH
jgi:hypothetical protein